MLGWFKRLFDAAPKVTLRRKPAWFRGRYDAAVTSDNNRRHWAAADGLSANAANSPDVRRTLRNRARYEVANNSYARGMILTLANDCIGTGPRLQMLTGDAKANRRIEREFQRWSKAVRLAEKLRTMRMACAEDGEAFAILSTNERLTTPIQLDLKMVEADQVTTPELHLADGGVDGIVFDGDGNPIAYHILKEHPGDTYPGFGQDYNTLPASHVIHLYRCDRPGQARGVPELTPALPLFAMLRDYSLATLDAAKAAAYFSGIIYTDAPANGESDPVEPLDPVELERNVLLTMPGGWKMSQLKAEHPSGTYSEFKREVLNEIARCLNLPYNIAAANTAGYNYASGRLDHQTYYSSIRVEQSHIETVVLDRLLAAWFDEAALIPGFLPKGRIADYLNSWFWDGKPHVDPAKEANAQSTRLSSFTTTLADEYARNGQDWETQLRQRAKEQQLMQELGLSLATSLPQPQDPNGQQAQKTKQTAGA